MTDLGLTHVALAVKDVDESIAFYEKYARMKVVHRRSDPVTKTDVAWISDLTRPFIIVLLKADKIDGPLLPESHLGVACKSREEIDRLCKEAQAEGILIKGPNDYGAPVGYWAYLRDPNGHTLEISYGQEVDLTLAQIS